MGRAKTLTPMELEFADLVAKGASPYAAARKVYSAETAKGESHLIVRRPLVLQAIEERRREVQAAFEARGFGLIEFVDWVKAAARNGDTTAQQIWLRVFELEKPTDARALMVLLIQQLAPKLRPYIDELPEPKRLEFRKMLTETMQTGGLS